MARITGGFCVPHTPYFPVALTEDSVDARAYARVRARLEEAAPDAIVVIACDHLNTFFYDNLPAFAVAAVERFGGPSDDSPGLSHREVESHEALGRALHAGVLERGFDAALSQRIEVDHGVMVPLHFLTPSYDLPVVPVFVNGLVPPLPRAERALAFGRAVGEAVRSFGEAALRVAVLATGGINLEVGGPRAAPGEVWGAPDPGWLEHVVERLWAGEVEELAGEATAERLAAVGNAAGELLCVLAMLGAVGGGTPEFLEPQPEVGHAYGAWAAS